MCTGLKFALLGSLIAMFVYFGYFDACRKMLFYKSSYFDLTKCLTNC